MTLKDIALGLSLEIRVRKRNIWETSTPRTITYTTLSTRIIKIIVT